MTKRALLIAILILFIALFYSLGKQIYDSLGSSYRLDQSTDEIAALQKKNSDLKRKLAEVDSSEFIEQQARDKLNMAKDGETVVIIPQAQINQVLGVEKKIEDLPQIPYYQGWIKLFFH